MSEKISSKKLVPQNTGIVQSLSTTIKTYLRKNITKGSPTQSGVYETPCSSCDLKYI